MSKLRLLAVDTATEACSAALYVDGEITQQYQVAPREHTQLILQMIETLLAESELSMGQLDALAFGRGPGSFTGVRIATGIIQGLGFALDLPVVGVSTLAAMAQQACHEHHAQSVLCAIDARMGGVYWAEYLKAENGLMRLSGTEEVLTPDATPLVEGSQWTAVGSGFKAHSEILQARFANNINNTFEDVLPQSKYMTVLAAESYSNGEAVQAKFASPVYLRNNVAKKSQKPNPLTQ